MTFEVGLPVADSLAQGERIIGRHQRQKSSPPMCPPEVRWAIILHCDLCGFIQINLIKAQDASIILGLLPPI
jgi:hypothetical protein